MDDDKFNILRETSGKHELHGSCFGLHKSPRTCSPFFGRNGIFSGFTEDETFSANHMTIRLSK